MRILLIQSHLGRREATPPTFPLGLCYIATALAGKHEVEILDLNLWEPGMADDVLEEKLIRMDPQVVGISIRNIDTTQRGDIWLYFKTVRPTAQLVKRVKPDVKLLVGGPGFSIFASEIMERIPEFDFGIYLEGEESTPELLDGFDAPEGVKGIYVRRGDSVMFTGHREPPDFDALPMPRRDGGAIRIEPYLGQDGSNIGIQSKRGCILHCGYCNYPFLTGRRLRLRSAVKVVDEIEYLTSLGAKGFSFVDNIFNVPGAHAVEICEEILRRGVKVEWSAWFEIKNTTDDLVKLAIKAGCRHFGFSPDAATDRSLVRLNKGITRADIEKVLNIVRNTKGMRAGLNLFFLPGMTPAEIIRTLVLFFKVPLVTRGRARVFGLGWIRINPHTQILRKAIGEGFLCEGIDLLPETERDLEGFFYCDPSLSLFDRSVIHAFNFTERIIKPFVKHVRSGLRRGGGQK